MTWCPQPSVLWPPPWLRLQSCNGSDHGAAASPSKQRGCFLFMASRRPRRGGLGRGRRTFRPSDKTKHERPPPVLSVHVRQCSRGQPRLRGRHGTADFKALVLSIFSLLCQGKGGSNRRKDLSMADTFSFHAVIIEYTRT